MINNIECQANGNILPIIPGKYLPSYETFFFFLRNK